MAPIFEFPSPDLSTPVGRTALVQQIHVTLTNGSKNGDDLRMLLTAAAIALGTTPDFRQALP